MSVKKVAGAGSPVARRCAFVGHLRNAINTAAVIELFVPIIMPSVPEFSADTVCNQRTGNQRPYHAGRSAAPPAISFPLVADAAIEKLLHLLTAGFGTTRNRSRAGI